MKLVIFMLTDEDLKWFELINVMSKSMSLSNWKSKTPSEGLNGVEGKCLWW